MQWLQGCRGTATPQMGILSRNIDSILGSFSAISTGYLGPTVNMGETKECHPLPESRAPPQARLFE